MKLAIFYHVGQIGAWKEVYEEQIARLQSSGLYDACDFIYCGINGEKPLPHVPDKMVYNYNQDRILEANTLEVMWNFCKAHPEYKVLYLHTKGVTREGWLFEASTNWRHLMELYVVDRWQQCVEILDLCDTCGILLRDKAGYNTGTEDYVEYYINFYDGNFWWATGEYISKLDPQFLYTDDMPWLRGKSELWIGTGENARMYNMKHMDYQNVYHANFKKELAMSERKSKIVMIAMFANEAPVLRRMLDSTLGYCDYYVMQNNGSTDGSDDIARQFLQDNNLQGEIYVCEEGWNGFGWNRDHLIHYCQEQANHNCDWILKMDCDEVLEVDDDFDWSPLDDHTIDSFHIAAVAGTTMYYRCWLWNAKRKWAFNHDPCHETIYCIDPDVGEHFRRDNLPPKIRQIGLNEGQSWSNPTKFVTDALVLEEKLISEGNMLNEDKLYHFWYIGKSYFDAHTCYTFPLEKAHQREYARRCIWYFQQWIKHKYDNNPIVQDESAYNALIFSAEARQFLDEWEEAIVTYKQAEPFAPARNDHIVGLVQCYKHVGMYDKMLECAKRLNEPERTNPFPHTSSFINNEHYLDTGTLPSRMLEEAVYFDKVAQENKLPFIINTRPKQQKRLFVVDDFYTNPDEVRNYALTQVEYEQDLRWYKGLRSKTVYRPEGIKEAFEHIIGQKIVDFNSGYNGVFQLMMSQDPQVYHYDTQRWAGMIYLTPNAPLVSGTRLHRSKRNFTTHRDNPGADSAFLGDFYDSTCFDLADQAANIYNRLVIMDAGCFHSAGPYFGNTMDTGRLTHLFFFD